MARISHSALSVSHGEKMVLSLQNGFKIEVFQGDLTSETACVFVNPTGRRLLHTAGVSQAISKAAGPQLSAECQEWTKSHGSLDSFGDTAYTTTGNLAAKFVVHVLGAHFLDDCNRHKDIATELLKLVYRNCFLRAEELGAKVVVCPALGTGTQCMPARLSSGAALTVLAELVRSGSFKHLKEVRFVDVNPLTVSAFADELQTKKAQFPTGNCYKEGSNRAPFMALPSTSASNSSKLSHLSYKSNGTGSGLSSEAGATEMEVDELHNGEISQNLETSEDGDMHKEDKSCSICIEDFDQATSDDPVKKLEKCGHRFHKSCIQNAFSKMQPKCPICSTWYGIPEGNQPKDGKMRSHLEPSLAIPGFQCNGAIVIHYSFPNGIQGPEHLRPTVPYHGTTRVAYLPNNAEGQKILKLLQKAFEHRLVFTVGDSHTTGAHNCVVWNNIHHKTNPHSGAQNFGYPDPTYLSRVEEELAAAGITADMI